jgi:hypothetical protein
VLRDLSWVSHSVNLRANEEVPNRLIRSFSAVSAGCCTCIYVCTCTHMPQFQFTGKDFPLQNATTTIAFHAG